MRGLKIAALQILLSGAVSACTEDGCKNAKPIYCEEDIIYACSFIPEIGITNRSPKYQYTQKIDCAKYNARCEQGVQGYVPGASNALMEPNSDFACVSKEYDCDAGEPVGCYSNAILSCEITPGLPVIGNTTDHGGVCP